MDEIHLLCAADARYGPYAGIMISSVLRNNPRERFHVHLFSHGVRRADLRKLGKLLARAGSHLTVYDIREALKAYPDFGVTHLNRMTYARLLAPELLPEGIGQILYLDCDIMCTGALAPLWRLGRSAPLLAAVPDRAGADHLRRVGMPPDATYFNSGVLLMNLAAWRRERISRALLEWIDANPEKLYLADQDATNACLYDRVMLLPECWNLQIGKDSHPPPAERLGEAALLHYTSIPKPWRYKFAGLGAEIFLDAKRQSPWRLKLPEFRLAYRLRKARDKRLARWRGVTRPSGVEAASLEPT